jgi:hypothetical protein
MLDVILIWSGVDLLSYFNRFFGLQASSSAVSRTRSATKMVETSATAAANT